MRAKTRVRNSRLPRPSAARRARLTPRKQPRQARSRATVDAILDGAAQVLTRRGYEGATTNRIAEQAGVSVGSLYQYFPNKEAIVGALIERHEDARRQVFRSGVAAHADQPMTALVPSVIDALFAAHLVEPELHRVLHEQVPRVGRLARLRQSSRNARAVVEEVLRARAAEVAVADVTTTAFVMVETVEALIRRSIEDGEVDAAAVRREAATLILRYLGVGR